MIRQLREMDWREARKEFGWACLGVGTLYGLLLVVWGFSL